VSFVECVGGHKSLDGKKEKMFNCNVGVNCGNRALQEAVVPMTKVVKCANKGFGLKAMEKIKAGSLVIEYVGEVLTERMKNERLAQTVDKNYYIMFLDTNQYLDGRLKGSESRFINHSCEPNCHLIKWEVGEFKRIAITALRDIEPEEELSYDYQMETSAADAFECFCGAPKCRGTMAPDNFNKEKIQAIERLEKKHRMKGKKKSKKVRTFKKKVPSHLERTIITSTSSVLVIPSNEQVHNSTTPEATLGEDSSRMAPDEAKSLFESETSEAERPFIDKDRVVVDPSTLSTVQEQPLSGAVESEWTKTDEMLCDATMESVTLPATVVESHTNQGHDIFRL
jgi:hypothetical protein